MKDNPFKKKLPGKGGTKIEVTIDGQKQIFKSIADFSKAYDINYSTAVRWAHTDDRIKIIEE